MTAETEQVQHTPGPWGLFYIDNPEGYDTWEVGPFNNPFDPFSGQADTLFSGVAGGAEQEANARLIAAAPELLEALEPFAALWDTAFEDARDDRQVFGFNDNTFSVGDIRAAIAAIRKARGEE